MWSLYNQHDEFLAPLTYSNKKTQEAVVQEVIEAIVKGLKSGISYSGARDIKDMQDNAEFIQITASGWIESMSR